MKQTSENRLERLLRFYRFNSDLFSDNEENAIKTHQKILRVKKRLLNTWQDRSDQYNTRKLENWLAIQ